MLNITHDALLHRFSAELEGQTARLDYELDGNVMSITHTWVPRPIGGRGVGSELMRSALQLSTAQGWTVKPVCSYAVAYMQKQASAEHSQHLDALLDEALQESFPASDSPSVGGAT